MNQETPPPPPLISARDSIIQPTQQHSLSPGSPPATIKPSFTSPPPPRLPTAQPSTIMPPPQSSLTSRPPQPSIAPPLPTMAPPPATIPSLTSSTISTTEMPPPANEMPPPSPPSNEMPPPSPPSAEMSPQYTTTSTALSSPQPRIPEESAILSDTAEDDTLDSARDAPTKKQSKTKQNKKLARDSRLTSPHKSLRRKEVNGSGAVNKPYACGVCDKRFYKYKEMIVHKETHTAEELAELVEKNGDEDGEEDEEANISEKDGTMFVEYKFVKEDEDDDDENVEAANNGDDKWKLEDDATLVFEFDDADTKLIEVEAKPKPRRRRKNKGRKKRILPVDESKCKLKDYHRCEVCQKYFTTKSDLRRHANIHNALKLYRCQDCNKYFHRKDNLVRHVGSNSCHKRQCTKCDMSFVGPSELKAHMKSVHQEFEEMKCKICMSIFVEEEHYKEHMASHRDIVDNEKRLKCLECEKLFKTMGNLKAHMRTHTGEKPYACAECGKCFSRQGNLQTHMRCHTGEKPCKCEVCGKTFKHISGLRYHLKTHNNEKPYECTICGKWFKCINGLKYHMENHPSTEKNLRCEECGEAFSQMNNLKLHRTIHTGQRVHICEVCNKHFLRSHELKVHMSVHSDEKPFKCETCEKCFSRNGALKIHMRTHMDAEELKKLTIGRMTMATKKKAAAAAAAAAAASGGGAIASSVVVADKSGSSMTLPSHNIKTLSSYNNKQNSQTAASPLAVNTNLMNTNYESLVHSSNSVITAVSCVNSSVIANSDTITLNSNYMGSNPNIVYNVKELASSSMGSINDLSTNTSNALKEAAANLLSPVSNTYEDLRAYKDVAAHQNNAASPSFNTMHHSFKDSFDAMSSGSNSFYGGGHKDLHSGSMSPGSSMSHKQFASARHLDLGPPVLTHSSNFLNYSARHLAHGANAMGSHGSMGHASSPMGHNSMGGYSSNSTGYSSTGHVSSPMGHSPSYMGHSTKQLGQHQSMGGSQGSMSPRPMSANNFLHSNYLTHGGSSMLQQQGTNSMGVPGDNGNMGHHGGGSMGNCVYPISSGVAHGVGPL